MTPCSSRGVGPELNLWQLQTVGGPVLVLVINGRSGAVSQLRSKCLFSAGIGSEDRPRLSGDLMINTWNRCGCSGEAQTAVAELKVDILALKEMRDRGERGPRDHWKFNCRRSEEGGVGL